MNRVTQTITLTGDEHYGRRLPPHALGQALTAIPTVACQSIAMVFRGRSGVRGPRRHRPAGTDRPSDTPGRAGKGGNPLSLRREVDSSRAEEEAGRDRRAPAGVESGKMVELLRYRIA
jgi:hypothetical protein